MATEKKTTAQKAATKKATAKKPVAKKAAKAVVKHIGLVKNDPYLADYDSYPLFPGAFLWWVD